MAAKKKTGRKKSARSRRKTPIGKKPKKPKKKKCEHKGITIYEDGSIEVTNPLVAAQLKEWALKSCLDELVQASITLNGEGCGPGVITNGEECGPPA